MSIALVTGSAGLIGGEASRYFAQRGLAVVGIDNDMRAHFFGSDASTQWQSNQLSKALGRMYRHESLDIRNEKAIEALFKRYRTEISVIVHAAAQPSHDWAAKDPLLDFAVNANGTLHLLEATRRYCPEAVFIFTSTNKVYGDMPNRLPLVELETRWEIEADHAFAEGVTDAMSIDQTLHSVFGASKVAADVMVQEYGRYFGLRTGCFRCGCLTGPNHSGAQLHGFLAYLMKCAITDSPYTVFGYKGKQVRDNMHSADLLSAFGCFFDDPKCGAVYNLGGGRFSNCSMLEAIEICESLTGREMKWSYEDCNRIGDHKWWISSLEKFSQDYPNWRIHHSIDDICEDIFEALSSRTAARQKL